MTTTRARLLALVLAAPLTLAGCSAGSLGSSSDDAGGTTSIVFSVTNEPSTVAGAEEAAEAFNASQSDYEVEVQARPAGSDGDNQLKTRLQTRTMDDVFLYNTGSLFQQIAPEQTLRPLTGEPFMDGVDETFLQQVTAGDDVYGLPSGTAGGGGVLYNTQVYADLGLSVPTTWDEFIANSQAIAAAGKTPVIQTYGETWTSQLLVLGDFHNVAAAEPAFADDYTAGQAKFATDPAAIRSFEHLQQVHDLGLTNADYASATLTDGMTMLADGSGVQYPMLTGLVSGLADIDPTALERVGFFALPGDSADTNGMTTWFPSAAYVPATTEGDRLEAAQAFLAFLATPEGCGAESTTAVPTGPYLIEGCEVPDDAPRVAQDVGAYFDDDAQSPALEFLSPVKGPSLDQITVQVGSGISTAAEGAALYDQDVQAQAQQLGLPGW